MRGLAERSFETSEAWAAWLEEHHGEPDGLWLKIAKKASGIATVTHAEALEVALAFGWIDGQRKALDANPAAKQFFATLNSQNRYAILYRVNDAKRPETRARRIAQFVEMLAKGEKLYP